MKPIPVISMVAGGFLVIGLAIGYFARPHSATDAKPQQKELGTTQTQGDDEPIMPVEFLGEHWQIDEFGHAVAPDRARLSTIRYEPRVMITTPATSMMVAKEYRSPYSDLHVMRDGGSLRVQFKGRAGITEWTYVPPNRVHVHNQAAGIDEIREIR